MRFSLAQLTRRTNPGIRRKAIVIRDIAPPAALATNLYRAVYLPVAQLWERVSADILAEYERTLSAMTTDSPSDLQARLDAAANDLERLFILLDASLREWGVQTERWQRDKWRGAVLSATGVDIQTLIGPSDVRETIESYLRWNSELVRDVSSQTRQRISNSVFSGLQNRTPVREVAKEISEATGLARDRSKRIAADQLSKVSAALADERRREAGLELWKWRHSGKRHPRETHLARNGNIYADSTSSEMVGREVEGRTVLAPPDEKDRPGRPPYCGCRAQSVLLLQ
jgi:hypothetical protein